MDYIDHDNAELAHKIAYIVNRTRVTGARQALTQGNCRKLPYNTIFGNWA